MQKSDHKFYKQIMSLLLTTCVLIITMFALPTQAASINDIIYCPHNYNTFNDHILNGGVGNYGNARRYYWIDSETESRYGEEIRLGMGNWIYTTNNPPYITTSISYRQTSTQSEGTIEFHTTYNHDIYDNAYTNLRLYREYPNPMTSNWGWAEVTMNRAKIELYNMSQYDIIGVASHEIGHTMGLAHCAYPGRIMCTWADNRYVWQPQANDLNTVNHLY